MRAYGNARLLAITEVGVTSLSDAICKRSYAALVRCPEFRGYPLFGRRKCIASTGIAVGTSTEARYTVEVRY